MSEDPKNIARLELIEREYRQGGLNPEDEAELARLQVEVFDELDKAIPLPFAALSELRAKIQQIQAELDSEASGSDD